MVSLVVMFWLVEPPLIDPLSLPMAITLFLLKDPIKLMPYEISGLGWSIHPKLNSKPLLRILPALRIGSLAPPEEIGIGTVSKISFVFFT